MLRDYHRRYRSITYSQYAPSTSRYSQHNKPRRTSRAISLRSSFSFLQRLAWLAGGLTANDAGSLYFKVRRILGRPAGHRCLPLGRRGDTKETITKTKKKKIERKNCVKSRESRFCSRKSSCSHSLRNAERNKNRNSDSRGGETKKKNGNK